MSIWRQVIGYSTDNICQIYGCLESTESYLYTVKSLI